MSPAQLKKIHGLILLELGLESLPPTVQEKIIAEVGQNIFMAVQLEIMRVLPESARKEYMRMIEANKPEAATALLQSHIRDVDQFVANIATRTLKEFKELEAAQPA
ncbi:MAG: hypothetical protein A2542_00100 [Parcubacteria group bacterium RIFOXYD2_FULL_52_8]|nr:MAG: hypothetical protein A2542_00100 [Parcubacteria group bacterium RIFOXYD2_FULL_52_8]